MNPPDSYLIARLNASPQALEGQTVLVTGAGGGIGLEAARALLWMGANVVIAEIDAVKGKTAAQSLADQFPARQVLFFPCDVGNEADVQALAEHCQAAFGGIDAVINNATLAPLGSVTELAIAEWDASYRVNLRGPVLLAKAFLPGMQARGRGVFVCVSSTGGAYLGGYETFKSAQVHLAETLDAELEGSGVTVLTIGPGLVPTETAAGAVARLAPRMGMTLDEFYKLNQNALLTPEEAGTGFALAVAFADRFRGMEISSLQAIKAADITYGSALTAENVEKLDEQQRVQARSLCAHVLSTLRDQSDGWKQRSIFERAWVVRDFKKCAGMSVEEWLSALNGLLTSLDKQNPPAPIPLEKLSAYYAHLAELAKGYEKDAQKLQENLQHVYSWRDEVDQLKALLG